MGLHAVCSLCHELLEFNADGEKLDFATASQQTLAVFKGNLHNGRSVDKKKKFKKRSEVPLAIDAYDAAGKICAAAGCEVPARHGMDHCPTHWRKIKFLVSTQEFDYFCHTEGKKK